MDQHESCFRYLLHSKEGWEYKEKMSDISFYCGKTFPRKHRLQNQKNVNTGNVHTGKKSFKCTFCEKHFTKKRVLTIHTRVHTGEKPYKCMECEKAFSQSSTLSLHIRTHSGEKPYKCLHCEKYFKG